MNTNASRPDILKKLFGAGLDSMRVSLNSVRQDCYQAYFRPVGYHFRDVENSIDTALNAGKFVSVNYLNCPGFTDTPEELEAMVAFIGRHPIHMIQWRNLNFDPLRYIKIMNKTRDHGRPVGMTTVLQTIRSRFPHVIHGYFNPPKEKFHLSGWPEIKEIPHPADE